MEKDIEMGNFEMWLRNISMIPQRMMMRYLRSRGWIVFWLDEVSRKCNGDICWLKLYQEEILRKKESGINK